MFRSRRALLPAALLAVLLSGCGSKNPVAGRVTCEGKPIHWGYVQFTPDIDKGTDGPTVTLMLSDDGRFSSAAEGRSMVTGEHKVLVAVVTETGPSPPTVERRFDITIPEGGSPELLFEIKKKGKGKSPGAEE